MTEMHKPADIQRLAFVRALNVALDVGEKLPPGELGEALCATLDTVAGGAPQYQAFGDVRSDAKWWADCASPIEIEIYLAAILRRLDGLNRSSLAMRARKRVFFGLWQAMPPVDQANFLKTVTKGGKEAARAD